MLGILQGLTEFLPVSSTAHLIIGARLIGYEDPGGIFTVMIQLGSVLAVMWLYRTTIVDVLTGLPANPDARRFALIVLAGCVPALIAGALFAGYIKRVLYYSTGVMAVSFIAGGVIMMLIERWGPKPRIRALDGIPVASALGVGLFQTLSLIPGVSRSGATIVGGMTLGLDRAVAAEFSFFLAMPTISAAFAHDFLEVRTHLSPDRALDIGIGFIMAFLAALVVVRPFVNFVRRSGFAVFAWYRIAAGAGLLAAVAGGWS
jgi:undecaprenyl-diphosphatase